MRKIALPPLAAVLGSFASALAASPSSHPPEGTAGVRCEINYAEGESVASTQEQAMAAEFGRLVMRYVPDAAIRTHLLRTLKRDPARALDFFALTKAAFSEADRAAFSRISQHFLRC